jgi:hypothetical protein
MSLDSASEIAIWERVIQPDRGDLPPAAAQFFLNLAFGQEDIDRMHELVVKNQQGDLSPEEAEALRNYRQVGMQIDFLRSKARQAVRRRNSP